MDIADIENVECLLSRIAEAVERMAEASETSAKLVAELVAETRQRNEDLDLTAPKG